MSCLQIFFSVGIIPNKANAQSYLKTHCAKITTSTSHGSAPRVVTPRATAAMVDGTSSSVRDIRPPTTSFRPSMWGDSFSTVDTFQDQVLVKYEEEMEELKKEVRSMLMAATSTNLLMLIDKLERLCLAFHFKTEIEAKLKQVYDRVDELEQDLDLFTTALRFRLLRQHQYRISCNDFGKFVDKDNKLIKELCSDVEGLLSLYEASHVRIHDEDVLDEAVVFTSNLLSKMLPELESPVKERVHHALDYPLHKSISVLNLRSYISIIENEEVEPFGDDDLVLKLAKLNFNFMQNIYRNELFQLTTWWNKFDLKSKIPYFRDRLVECYVWGMAYHFEPQYSCVRMLISKIYIMFVTVDDTYDNYATLEEIQLFTTALERWNINEADLLPGCINEVYKFVLNVSGEFGREAEKQGKSFAVPYYIEAVKQAGRGYAQEQQWIMEQEMPSFDEYMINSWITALFYVSFITVIPGIKAATRETIEWLLTDPIIFTSAAELGRLLDDIASHQRESKEGKMLTIVDCYMKDKGVSKHDALCAFEEIIEDRWKHLNAEWVKSRGSVPKEMVVQFLNIAQVSEMCYKNKEDGVTYPERNWAPLVSALFLDPIIV